MCEPCNRPKCEDCQVEIHPFKNMVVIPNYIWSTIAESDDFLCPTCIEKRLGRSLTPEDFPYEDVAIYEGQMNCVREIICNQFWFSTVGWKLGDECKTLSVISVGFIVDEIDEITDKLFDELAVLYQVPKSRLKGI